MRLDLDGKGRQTCLHKTCGRQSLVGHVKGQGLCPFHWCEWVFGLEWARECFPHYTPKITKRKEHAQ